MRLPLLFCHFFGYGICNLKSVCFIAVLLLLVYYYAKCFNEDNITEGGDDGYFQNFAQEDKAGLVLHISPQNKLLYKFFANYRKLYPYQPLTVLDYKLAKCLANTSTCHDFLSATIINFGLQTDPNSQDYNRGCLRDETFRCNGCTVKRMPHCWIYQDGRLTVLVRCLTPIDTYLVAESCFDQPKLAILPSANMTPVYINGVAFLTSTNHEFYHRQLNYSRLLDCNKKSTGSDGRKSTSQPIIHDGQFLELVYLRDLLYLLNVTPILFGGTTLGWYRECGIIPDTQDFDITIPISQYSRNLEAALLNEKELQIHFRVGMPNDSLELSFLTRAYVKIDIFFLYEESKYSWVGGFDFNGRQKLRWIYPTLRDNICTAALKGHLFYVPCNVEDFITADYGYDWRVPIPNARFIYGQWHHNVRKGDTISNTSDWYHVYELQTI